MTVPFCYLLNVILLSRLATAVSDEPLSRKRVTMMILLQGLGLLAYRPTWALAAVAGALVLIAVLIHFIEHRLAKTYAVRLGSLLAYLVLLSVPFSPGVGLSLRPGLKNLLRASGRYSMLSTLAANVDWVSVHVTLLGLLLVINEANLVVRCLLSRFALEPRIADQAETPHQAPVDEKEYTAGRVIGVLERILVYHLVLNDHYQAIPLILAAKSFTRFKELEKREYAEYVLVGTLTSTLLAMLSGAMARWLLP